MLKTLLWLLSMVLEYIGVPTEMFGMALEVFKEQLEVFKVRLDPFKLPLDGSGTQLELLRSGTFRCESAISSIGSSRRGRASAAAKSTGASKTLMSGAFGGYALKKSIVQRRRNYSVSHGKKSFLPHWLAAASGNRPKHDSDAQTCACANRQRASIAMR